MDELTISQIQGQMASGELTACSLTEAYLDAIETRDRNGPALNAIIEVNPDALAIADALDEERRTSGPRGPLHGVPVVLKDNIDTADKMMTTAGSLALAGSIAARDATVTRRLREAGAIILAKANLSEWANFRSPHSSSGWSSRGGQTRNPYALDRNPCGSSSGSAVAAAANLCAAAVGTETNGSIICPSQTNGIVGIKPTVGLISRAGIIPISHNQDTAGPMARTVADAAILLGAMTGVDDRDETTRASEGKALTDYTPFLDPDGLKGARIGVARNRFGSDARITEVMETAIDAMKQCGAEVIDPIDLARPPDLDKHEGTVLVYDFRVDLNAYLAELGPDIAVHSLADLIAFNEEHAATIMPFFGQERMTHAEEKVEAPEAYLSALQECRRLAREVVIDAALNEHHLDAIVSPSGGPAWLTDLVSGDCYRGGGAPPAAPAGYPVITVPAGTICGLPIGISFVGTAYQEPTLIKLAYAFEQATHVRRPPQYLPTVDFSQG